MTAMLTREEKEAILASGDPEAIKELIATGQAVASMEAVVLRRQPDGTLKDMGERRYASSVDNTASITEPAHEQQDPGQKAGNDG